MKLFIAACFSLSVIALADTCRADEKKGAVKGSLVLGEKTYTFAHAIAYETKIAEKKRTVAIFTEEPLKIEKLKESFKNKA